MPLLLRLGDLVQTLPELDVEHTIYARAPWSENSEAIVAAENADGRPPGAAVQAGLQYFLEVSVAREFIEDWSASLTGRATTSATVQRLIKYAENDA